jgi:excisionase family DNA binding protein
MSDTSAELTGSTSRAIATANQADNALPLVVPPRQACALLSIGLTRCYELLGAGELESFKDGKSRKITVSSIRAYVDRRLRARKS